MTGVAIIGTGRLGTSLGLALSKKGYDIRWLADKNMAAARESRGIIRQGKATTDIAKAATVAELVFLCVPDDEIERTARTLARSSVNWRHKYVFHTSGILPSRVLAGLKAKGASCASFHPVQSFSRKNTPTAHFKNITIGLEGDAKAVRIARNIAQKFGARPLLIKARDKVLYHAADSMASNLFVSLFDMACALLRSIRIQDKEAARILLPLVEGTLQNVKHFDRAEAFTGPISRGDADTVQKHLAALKKFPSAHKAYQVLGAEALRLAKKKGVLPKKIKSLKRMLEET